MKHLVRIAGVRYSIALGTGKRDQSYESAQHQVSLGAVVEVEVREDLRIEVSHHHGTREIRR